MFLRRAKTRRTKMAIFLAVLCVLLVAWGYRESGFAIVRNSLVLLRRKPLTSTDALYK